MGQMVRVDPDSTLWASPRSTPLTIFPNLGEDRSIEGLAGGTQRDDDAFSTRVAGGLGGDDRGGPDGRAGVRPGSEAADRAVHLQPQHQHSLGTQAHARPGNRDRRQGGLSGDRALDPGDRPPRPGRRDARRPSPKRSAIMAWRSSTSSAFSSGPSTTNRGGRRVSSRPDGTWKPSARSVGPGSPHPRSGRPIRRTSTFGKSPTATGHCSRSAMRSG